MRIRSALFVTFGIILALAGARPAGAQTFDAAGTRAAGMSGAFVAVADDASAAYWNPAGFAAGSFFSVVLDGLGSEARPEGSLSGGSRSGVLFALGAPALGLSYYRLRQTRVTSDALAPAGALRLDNLVTHHAGATLVQSVAPGLAVGATLKFVRGVAGTAFPEAGRDEALDEGADILGRASNAFDADIGVMFSAPRFKAGLTVRNLLESGFETAGGHELTLERQARAGVAVTAVEGWVVAADVDLLRSRDLTGHERRDVALGTEGRLGSRLILRTGARLDTLGNGPGGRAATVSAGASYAASGGVWLDGSVTGGSRWGGRGWGLAARFVY